MAEEERSNKQLQGIVKNEKGCFQENDSLINKKRQLQDSNLRGQSPTDFESVSLTTRTSCLGQTITNTLFQ